MTATATATARERRAIWLAAWPVTAVMMLPTAATPLFVLWQERLGFSAGVITIVYACYIAGLLGALPVAGALSDRIGRRAVLLPVLALGVAACAIFATATSVAALAVARLLTGVAVGTVLSTGTAAVADLGGTCAPRRRLAALLASTAVVVGAGSGPLVSGVLSERLPGPTVVFFLLEAALLITAFVTVLRLPLRKPAGSVERRAVRLPSVPADNRGQLLAGIAVFAPGITATGFVLALGPSLLSDLVGTDSRIVSGAMVFVMFAAATGAQFAMRGARVRAVLATGAVATVLSMATLIVAVRTSSAVLLVAAAILAGPGQGLGQLGGLSLLSARVPGHRLAEANAALSAAGYLPAGLLPVAAGFLSDEIGLANGATVFGTAMILAALAGGAFVLMRPGAARGARDGGW